MTDDRRDQLDVVFQALLLKWLTELPPDGWWGAPHRLGNKSDAFGKQHTTRPPAT